MIIIVLSCFFYALPSALYIPSIIFYIPFYLYKINTRNNQLNFLIVLSTIYFTFAVVTNINFIQIFTLIKSYILTIIYPISFGLGLYLKHRFKDHKFLLRYINYTFPLLFLVLTTPLFYYEPSAAARQYLGSLLLIYFILINYELNQNLKRLIIFFTILITLRILTLGSLSFLVIVIFSSILTVGFIAIKLIVPLSLKIKKSNIKLIMSTVILVLFMLIVIYQFNIIDVRRLRALNTIFEFLRSLNLDSIMTISGGRFLATFSGYQGFIDSPFDLSNFLLDKPSISSKSPYFDNLLIYSGLGEQYLTSRRPTSLVSWLFFNLKILALPIVLHIVINTGKLIKKIFQENDIKYFIFYSFSLSYILLIGFISSQPSLCIPWIILGFCSYSESPRQIKNN